MMDTTIFRNQIRDELAACAGSAAALASLVGKPFDEDQRLRALRVRGPYPGKPEIRQAAQTAEVLRRTLDVLRMIEAENPEALERAITVINDAAQAEAEAPEAVITGEAEKPDVAEAVPA
jgi:hypothetical protein